MDTITNKIIKTKHKIYFVVDLVSFSALLISASALFALAFASTTTSSSLS